MQKGFALPLILVLLTSLIGVGGYYFYQSTSKDSQNTQIIQPSPQPKEEDNTNGWKDYKGQGYSIRIPNNYHVEVDTQLNRDSFSDGVETMSAESFIIFKDKTNHKDPCSIETNRQSHVPVDKTDRCMKIGSYKAFEFGTNTQIGPEQFWYYFINDGTLYTIAFLDISQEKKDEILQSFKFLDDETANWKTYTNTKQKFSLSIPRDYEVIEKDYSTEIGSQIEIFISDTDPSSCRGDCPYVSSSDEQILGQNKYNRLEGYFGSMDGTPQSYVRLTAPLNNKFITLTLRELGNSLDYFDDREPGEVPTEKVKIFERIATSFKELQ